MVTYDLRRTDTHRWSSRVALAFTRAAVVWWMSGTAALRAQAPTGSIAGTLEDSTGRPLPHVLIGIDPSGRKISTDSLGSFHIDGLAPDVYTLRVLKLGVAFAVNPQLRVEPGVISSQGRLRVFSARRREVYLGCATPSLPAHARCDTGRVIPLSFLADLTEPYAGADGFGVGRFGVGVVRDSVTWDRLLSNLYRGLTDLPADRRQVPMIDWKHDMVIIIGSSFADPLTGDDDRLDRIVEMPDRTTIVFGPDTLQFRTPPGAGGFADAIQMPYAVAVPRSDRPISLLDTGKKRPELVDLVAMTAPRSGPTKGACRLADSSSVSVLRNLRAIARDDREHGDTSLQQLRLPTVPLRHRADRRRAPLSPSPRRAQACRPDVNRRFGLRDSGWTAGICRDRLAACGHCAGCPLGF